MVRVVCRAGFCAHNVGQEFCNAAVIVVNVEQRFGGEKTDCSTFIPRDFSASMLSLDNVNYAGLVAQAFSRMPLANPKVQCEVHICHYHGNDGGCDADIIEISPQDALTSTETFCQTFST